MSKGLVLVTGGSGFLGHHLIKELISSGYKVRSLDLSKPDDASQDAEYVLADVRDRSAVEKAMAGADIVVHNAAIVPISRAHKKVFWDINVLGTDIVLSCAAKAKVDRVIFISSSAPYGIPRAIPITEDTPFAPVCDYGWSKVEAEKICGKYIKNGLNVITVRPRTIVGAYRLGTFQILYSWIMENRSIYTIGSGDNLISFVSAKDLVAGCLSVMQADCFGEDFNFGGDRFSTVKDDIGALIKHANSLSVVRPVPARLAKGLLSILDKLNLSPFTSWHYMTADKDFYFDVTKAKDLLGWRPKDSNIEMLISSFDHYKAHHRELDRNFGFTHTNVIKQKAIGLLKKIS